MKNDKLEVRQFQNTFIFIKLFGYVFIGLLLVFLWIFGMATISTLVICAAGFLIYGALLYIMVVKGVIINRLSMNDRGFDFIEVNKEPIFVPWESINFACRTKHFGNCIVLRDVSGNEFWFNTNKATEDKLCAINPSLAALIPPKDDVRKWQEWDKKEEK